MLTLPFGIAQGTKLRPVIHSGSFIGIEVPVWDVADNFGDTNLLVTNMAQASDLAKCLGENSVALMRGHGFASAARFADRGRAGIGLPAAQCTRADAGAAAGQPDQVPVARAIEARNRGYSPYSVETWRTWEYWANKAGCAHLLTRPDSMRTRQKADPQIGRFPLGAIADVAVRADLCPLEPTSRPRREAVPASELGKK